MNKQNETILKDIMAFIEWSIENDKPLDFVLFNLAHDTHGLLEKQRNFLPRTHGYQKRVSKTKVNP